MNGTQYRIDTLAEIAAIPVEALPRFFAELPTILKFMRQSDDLTDGLNEAFDTSGIALAGMVWVDDGATDITVTGHAPDGDELFSFSSRAE